MTPKLAGGYDLSDYLREKLARQSDALVLSELQRVLDTGSHLSVMEWAERYRILESGSEPGPFVGNRTPYVYEIAECLLSSKPEHQVIAVKKGSQLALTELAVNYVGRMIHQDACDILYFMETGDKVSAMMKNRIRPMLARTPFNFPPPGKGTGDNTRNHISYPGGSLQLMGAGSTSSFSSNPARVCILDELARYDLDIGGEGDPLSLAKGRISSYGARGKVYIPSTPTDDEEAAGSYETIYQMGNAMEFYVPCHNCGHMDYLHRERFEYTTQGKDLVAFLICRNCSQPTYEYHKPFFLPRGEWRATKERESIDVTSFHVPGLLAPIGWKPWNEVAQSLINAKKGRIKLKPVLNLAFGEGYTEVVENAEPSFIKKTHSYKNASHGDTTICILPESTLFVTMAVDTQGGWMRWEKKAWDYNDNSWSLCFGTISHGIETAEGKDKLRKEIEKELAFTDGTLLRPRVTTVDSGGKGWTQHVYEFCATFPQPLKTTHGRMTIPEGQNVVIPTKGSNNLQADKTLQNIKPIKSRIGGSIRTGYRLFTIGTTKVKLEAYRSFNLAAEVAESATGRALFRDDYPDEYFAELASEKIKSKRIAGRATLYFEDPPANVRNEALDTHIMNIAAAALMKEARSEVQIKAGLQRLREGIYPGAIVRNPAHMPAPAQPAAPPKRKSFISGLKTL